MLSADDLTFLLSLFSSPYSLVGEIVLATIKFWLFLSVRGYTLLHLSLGIPSGRFSTLVRLGKAHSLGEVKEIPSNFQNIASVTLLL
jgi:hypothetical protein